MDIYVESYKYKPSDIVNKYDVLNKFTHAIKRVEIESLGKYIIKEYLVIRNEKVNILSLINLLKDSYTDTINDVIFSTVNTTRKRICVLTIKEKNSVFNKNTNNSNNKDRIIELDIRELLNHVSQLCIIYNTMLNEDYDIIDREIISQVISNLSDILYKSTDMNERISIVKNNDGNISIISYKNNYIKVR